MPKARATPTEILLTPMEENDANASTIGQYLFTLTRTLWDEEESFSGKRPFGNSGWQSDVAKAMILNRILDGELDEDGYVEDYVDSEFEALMNSVFDLLYKADYASISLPPAPKDWYLLKFDSSGDLVDKDEESYSEEDAQAQVDLYNYNTPSGIWKSVHVPQ